ncbi:MAG: M20 family metallo-hydrolase [Deltaproteobacteria bacterium]|nr:M20 family metallo-hydrolase [Deltaproteobacteria bacterium]MBW1952320.1 M20 family metallo-hydrolase [Deltaproteobacteria bacterium]MBW1986511.1 M20 family metallo-hydrolase [Deltaproteobacteria bacterium]MBW2135090.1 M20 family metallo-hydrolase [Deltaproteobacteria bacterium]
MERDRQFELVKQRIAGYREEMVNLQRELVRRVAVGPDHDGPGEGDKAAFLTEILTQWGLKVENYPAPDERVSGGSRPNLVALLPGSQPEKIWVLSHLDVVPPGELNLWESDPFTLRVEGDRLYGRGTEDNHHGIIISLFAVKALIEAGLTPTRQVALALVSDEETGSHKGLAHLLEHHRELFSERDLIIVPDAGNADGTLVEISEKSLLWLRFEIKGRQCHASKPHLGINTLRACAHLIVALESLRKEFNHTDPLFFPPVSTFEPTKKEANVPNINTVPGHDVFYLDCRILPVYDLSLVKTRITEIASNIQMRFGVEMSIKPVQEVQSPPATPVEAPVVQALSRAIEAVYQRQARPGGIGGGTVAAFFRRAGLPAAVWSTVCDTAHQPNEYNLLPNLIGDCQVLAYVMLDAE